MASDTFHHPDLESIYFDECEALGRLQKQWLQPVITQRKDLHNARQHIPGNVILAQIKCLGMSSRLLP